VHPQKLIIAHGHDREVNFNDFHLPKPPISIHKPPLRQIAPGINGCYDPQKPFVILRPEDPAEDPKNPKVEHPQKKEVDPSGKSLDHAHLQP